VEGTPYSYQLAASGNAVTFAMASAPTGATLSGNTVSWTPTAAQARTSNSFTVSASAPGSAPTTQSWTVTPSGTIRISHIDTWWSSTGTSKQPLNWVPVSPYVAALIPQSNGLFQPLSGSVGADGSFNIDNVPAGYYWLRLSPNEFYWTSSSAFDAGNDYSAAALISATPSNTTTSFSYNLTGLDATSFRSFLQINGLESPGMDFSIATVPGSSMFTTTLAARGVIDFSKIKSAVATQYEPVSIGAVAGYVAGPSVTLSNLSLTNGGNNTITGQLNPVVPASIKLSIKGSDWTSLFDRTSPIPTSSSTSTPGTSTGTGVIVPVIVAGPGRSFNLSVQPYLGPDDPNVANVRPLNLIYSQGNFAGLLFASSSCLPDFPMTTDVAETTVQYSDPFPAVWRRVFSVCQTSLASIQLPDGKMQSVTLVDKQITVAPTGPVKPLISAVQNPKINGGDLFAATTLKSGAATLTWDAPATGAPFGYSVAIYSPVSVPNGVALSLSPVVLSTAKTSMVLPPDLLRAGQTYYIVITAQSDAKANMETSPHRSSLPTASAQLVSGVVTIAN